MQRTQLGPEELGLSCRGLFPRSVDQEGRIIRKFLASKRVIRLTQSSKPLQFVLAVRVVRPADLEDLVLAVAAGLAQQSPVGA